MRLRARLAWLCLSLPALAGTPGALRFGTVPAGSGAHPVLLFVHGWASDASTWSGSNDMEARATAAGYRTAFLDVHPDRTMWDNGPLVSGAVDQVKSRFPGAGVVLVCHSKGGVDGQTALVYHGGAAKVERLITLGTPHRGTPLADLAWSAWAGWLADLVGSKNEGNRVLQTGYMASFRAQTDARPESRAVPTYTAGGTKAGPWFSSYWYGGIAIGRTSDGVVPLDSTDLPYQRARLFTRSWNHAEVKQGSLAWPYLQASLAMPVAVGLLGPDIPGVVSLPDPGWALDRLYRGGATVSGMAEFTFPVDANQPLLRVLLRSGGTPRRVMLLSPSGRVHMLTPGVPLRARGRMTEAGVDESTADGAFPGAVLSQAAVASPEAGLWRVQLSAQGEDAYFFTAIFPGDAGRGLGAIEARAAVRGGVQRSGEGVAVHTRRIAAGPGLRGPWAAVSEPVVLNHTLVFTAPGWQERAVIFSETE